MRLLKYLIGFLLFYSLSAAAEENITNFSSHITINKDASLDISEVITINAEGNIFRHGIVRWYPINRGRSIQPEYLFGDILNNGFSSNYEMVINYRVLSIYIGDDNYFLSPGMYTYTIHYHVNDAIQFLEKNDLFYWNITGNYWQIPILKAEADITFPPNSKMIHYDASTGKLNEQNKNFQITQPTSNQLVFTTTAPLMPGEGLSVVIAFPKGTIDHLNTLQKIIHLYKTNHSSLFIVCILIFTLLYYLLMWQRVGPEPKKGYIAALSKPPADLSPAALRYIYQMGFDRKILTVAILSMASKKFITIKQNKNNYILIKNTQDISNLSEEEAGIAATIFDNTNQIVLDKRYNSKIVDSLSVTYDILKKNNQKKYFTTNLKYTIIPHLLGFIAILLTCAESTAGAIAFFYCGWLMLGMYVFLFVFSRQSGDIKIFAEKISYTQDKSKKSGMIIYLITFCLISIVFLPVVLNYTYLLDFITAFLILLINIGFTFVLIRPTQNGEQMINQIEGFKLYLTSSSVPHDITIFEKFLPYAVALNIEKAWYEQFANTIPSMAATQPNLFYLPLYSFSSSTSFSDSISRFDAYTGACSIISGGRGGW